MIVTRTCRGCREEFTYDKPPGPGRFRSLCDGCADSARRRRRAESKLRRAAPLAQSASSLCGCGRDYLTLPLDHACTFPLPP